jgi:ribosomal protein L13E
MVSSADKFDEAGRLVDERTRSKVKELLEALVLWIEKFGWMGK